MSIRIPVEADFNSADLEKTIQRINQQIAAMGAAVAKASGQKFEPITLTSKRDLEYFVKQSQQLLKIQGELNKRMAASGQSGKTPFEANWSKMYLDENQRIKRMREALVFMGAAFEDPAAPARPAPAGGSSRAPTRAPEPPTRRQPGVGTQIVGGGLRAFGPVGGVAAGSLSTGMSMGMGAGLMGLLGGLGALGLGKLVGMATEKMGQAEDNAVAYDTLKRTLGDVNVSFGALKAVLETSADNVKVTFNEAARLGSQFAKLGNLTADQYKSLSGELETGVGLSRAYGLDPSQGMGFLGTMRGMKATGNEQESRKMALLIGETIARSNAFAKADEVMDAIASYTTQQTRASLGANVAGYAGMFSGLTGSGIPGLDPAGAAGLLARVNASLAAGGAKGEASQFFSATIGARYGLDPFQMQAWREGGAFATLDSTFGRKGSVGRFGMAGPGGNTTWLQATLDEVRRQYGGNTGRMGHALANHLGVSMSQALALANTPANATGEMERLLEASGVRVGDLNAAGIGNIGKILTGGASARSEIADSLRRRTGTDALTPGEVRRLDDVMANGTESQQKELLTSLVASRDQEQTQGKDIRDSKTALDNIKTSIADRLIPLTQEMRHGIMYIAGQGKMSATDIQEQVMRADSKGRRQAIEGKYKALIDEQGKRIVDARMSEDQTDYSTIENSRRIQEEANREINRLKREQADLLAEENDMMSERIKAMREDESRKFLPAAASPSRGPSRRYRNGRRAASAGVTGDAGDALYSALLQQESGGRHTDAAGNLITSSAGARGISQVMPATGVDPGFGVAPLRDNSEEEYRRFGRDYLNAMLRRYGGDRAKALAAYNAGPGSVDKAIKQYGDNWLNGMPEETRNYIPSILGKESQGMPLPDGGTGPLSHNLKFDALSIDVIHKNDRGEHVAPPQRLTTNVRPAAPFGTERFA
jgi:soluble lytic murein transglycosylase-like protein